MFLALLPIVLNLLKKDDGTYLIENDSARGFLWVSFALISVVIIYKFND
jgi:hypothetical protein